jgi:hypothetical protein
MRSKANLESPWELSNGVSHSTCTHQGRVDSRLLVVGSQTASLTPGPSFDHNLCCRCPNARPFRDSYTSRPFRWYKEHLKARCFDCCNRTLSFLESWRTLKSHFQECEWRPHTSLKVGLRHISCFELLICWCIKAQSILCLHFWPSNGQDKFNLYLINY